MFVYIYIYTFKLYFKEGTHTNLFGQVVCSLLQQISCFAVDQCTFCFGQPCSVRHQRNSSEKSISDPVAGQNSFFRLLDVGR